MTRSLGRHPYGEILGRKAKAAALHDRVDALIEESAENRRRSDLVERDVRAALGRVGAVSIVRKHLPRSMGRAVFEVRFQSAATAARSAGSIQALRERYPEVRIIAVQPSAR